MTEGIALSLLGRHDGTAVLRAQEAIVKGVLECTGHVSSLMWAQSETSRGLAELLADPAEREVLAMHRLAVTMAPDAQRAMTMGLAACAEGGLHVVLGVGRGGLRLASALLNRTLGEGAGLVVVMDLPGAERSAVLDLGLTVLEPGCICGIRDAVEPSLRISRAAKRPVIIAIDADTLRSGGSVDLHPNHGSTTPRREGSRHRAMRWDRSESPLRMGRRLELNTFRELPSPGEMAQVGFVTVGAGDGLLQLALQEETRAIKDPVLHLGLSSPIDEAAVSRLLTRCGRVVVVERGGESIANKVRAIADTQRLRGEDVASVTSAPYLDSAVAFGLWRQSALDLAGIDIATPAKGLLEPPHVDVRAMGPQAMRRRVRDRLRDVLEHWAIAHEAIGVQLDGLPVGDTGDTTITVETWTASGFRAGGGAAVRQALGTAGPCLHVIVAGAPPRGVMIERLAAAFVPPELALAPAVLRVPVDDEAAVTRAVQDAMERQGTTLLVLGDVDGRWDVDARERQAAETDRSGFRPLQRIVQGVDRFCSPHAGSVTDFDPGGMDPELRSSVHVKEIDGPWRPRLAMRIRPQLEMIEIIRSQAPRAGVGQTSLPIPVARHAEAPCWHAHFAGYRGASPGVAAMVLVVGGEAMGYQVDWRCDTTAIGPGQRAWTQLRFEQQGAPPMVRIDPGGADLVLSISDAQAVRAMRDLNVCHPERTCLVAASGEGSVLPPWFSANWHRDRQLVADVEETCRRRFHTSRLADVVLLGAAFQSGWIPLTVDAIQSALQRIERRGHARLAEAFAFGRRAAVDTALLSPERSASPVDTPVRRARRWRLLAKLGTRRSDQKLGTLLDRVLQGLPGLTETTDGRTMRGVLVDGLAAATTWGGIDVAHRLADDILALYRADRADTGRALTRAAIGPLVETALLRDPIHVARMAVSPGHRAALRRSLDVRPSRGDVMEIRYLTRLEFAAGSRLLRFDLRTSDWIAGLVASLGSLIPTRWRGSPQQRARRAAVRSIVQRATADVAQEYDLWRRVLTALRAQFEARTLHAMSADVIADLPNQLKATPADA